MSPRPQIDHIRRPQILAAAAEVIAERGVAATRIADIAEQAGTSTSAILYWFESKDGLLAEALTFEEQRYYESLADQLDGAGGPSERMRLLIESAAGGSDWALWMELWTRALRDRKLGDARRRLDDRWREKFAAVVRDGQAAGEFGPIDADEAAVTLTALLDGLAVQNVLDDPAVSSEERMRELSLRAAETLLDVELTPVLAR
jgi:AcrR family transcriptional regulator